MGKNLKVKECGKGICQRKDGKYTARFCSEYGMQLTEKDTLTVNKTLEYRHKQSFWRAGPPKTVPMIPTFTSSVMRQALSAFACTPCVIITLLA